MKAGDGSVVSAATTLGAANNREGVSLEGWLLKQGSRTKTWNDRYFVLNGNGISYYDKPDDLKAKDSLVISNEAGCEVGSLYIDERQKGSKKELIYCIKITWSTMEPATKDETEEAVFQSSRASPPIVDIGLQTPSRESVAVTPMRGDSGEVEFRPISSDGDRRSLQKIRKSAFKSKEDKTRNPAKLLKPIRLSRTKTEGSEHSRLEGHPPLHNRSVSSITGTPVRDDKSEIESPPKSTHRRCRSDSNFLEGADHLATPVLNDSYREGRPPSLLPRSPAPERTPSKGTVIGSERYQPTLNKIQAQHLQEQQLMQSLFYATKKANNKKMKKKIVVGTKVTAAVGAVVSVGVITAGLGLLAGLVFLGAGAAAGGGTVVAGAGLRFRKKKQGEMVIGTSNYELARRWKVALDACLASETVRHTTWGHMFTMEGRNTASAVLPTSEGLATALSRESLEERAGFGRVDESQHFVDPATRWHPMEGGWATLLGTGAHGLRIFREDRQSCKSGRYTRLSVKGQPSPPLKGQVVLNATPLDSFMCFMSLPRLQATMPLVPNSGQRASFRVVEYIDEHMDIIHLVFHPLFLFPTWTAPRDFVLFRYWRLESDGTYVICCDTVQHALCPPHPEYTRGEMHGVYTISPRKKTHLGKSLSGPSNVVPECLLTAVVQVDPRGWVPNKAVPVLANQGYGEAFAVSALLQLLDIRDALDFDRFVPVASDFHGPNLLPDPDDFGLPSPRERKPRTSISSSLSLSRSMSMDSTDDDPVNYDFAYAMKEAQSPAADVGNKTGIISRPPPLPAEKWAEPDSNSFRVRGKMYNRDKKKINAGRSIGRLIAVDVVMVEKTIYSGFCNHPTQRVQLALERERRLKEKGLESDMPPFLFVVNICLPGPPFFHGVFYYAVDDMSSIDGSDGTPSSKLCKEFLFGDDDKFRDETFKLIPQIVEGNFIVRKAVGSTPAIMGTKLAQTYARSDRFCEVILDCGSSSVATGVIRLTLGSYAQELVVDMGFLLEGRDETTLPERIFGCVRIKKLLFGFNLRFVEQPPEANSM